MASWVFLCIVLPIVYSKIILAISNGDSNYRGPVSSDQHIQQGIARPVRLSGCPLTCSCKMDDTHHIISVDCSNRGLKDVPDLPYTTVKLSFWNNSISNITCDSFKHLHSLQDLNIGRNNISHFPPCVFQSQTRSLLSLNVSENYVTYLDVKLFQNVSQLETLDFSFNLIELLAPRTFSDLARLVDLDLSFNLIKEIAPEAFRGLHSLKNLSLENNFLDNDTSFHKDIFQDLGALETLNTQANLGILDDAVSPLRNLTTLYMDVSSNYTMLGTGFRQLVNLKHLHLSKVFYNLPAIRPKLNSTCSMTTVPSNFFNNIRTEKAFNLHMSDCGVQTIGNFTFLPLSTLVFLDLSLNMQLYFGLNGQSWMQSLIHTSITDLNLSFAWLDFKSHTLPTWFFQTLSKTNLTILKIGGDYIDNLFPVSYFPTTIKYLDIRLNPLTLFDLYISFLYSDKSRVKLKEINVSGQGTSHTARTVVENKVQDIHSSDTYSRRPDGTERMSVLLEKPDRMRMNGSQFLNISIGETTTPSPADLTTSIFPTYFHQDPNIKVILLPSYLETIVAYDSMTEKTVVPHIRITQNTVLRDVDLRSNPIASLLGPVENVPSLKRLDLSGNGCNELSVHFFKYMDSLEVLILGDNVLGLSLAADINGVTFSRLPNLRLLDLSKNSIKDLSRQAFTHNTKLEAILLNTNRLNKIQPTFSTISSMSYLDLSDNLLPGLEDQTCEELKLLKSRNETFKVNLLNNQLLFTCDYLSFLELVFSRPHIFSDVELMEFRYLNETKLDYTEFGNQFPSLARECQVQRFFDALLITFFIVVGTVTICGVIYHKRWKLRYLYHIKRLRMHIRDERFERLPTADVFITYDQDDTEWRRFMRQKFLPGLKQRNISYVLGEKDFPGGDLMTHVTEAVLSTKKTVVLLSEEIFKYDYYREHEMNLAIMREIHTRSVKIVPVFVEAVKLASYPREIELFLRDERGKMA